MNENRPIAVLGLSLLMFGFAQAASPEFTHEQPKPPVIPDKYTNLKVLPPDITKAQLLPIMKGFAKSSGHRCSYCHVATDDLSSADFALDEKPPKNEARELLRLIRDLK